MNYLDAVTKCQAHDVRLMGLNAAQDAHEAQTAHRAQSSPMAREAHMTHGTHGSHGSHGTDFIAAKAAT